MTDAKALDKAVKRVIWPSNLQAAAEGFWRFGLGKPSAVVEAFAPAIRAEYHRLMVKTQEA